MPITKFGEIFYADYSDAFGVRRRISLQTKDFDKAQLKFEELLRRKDAIRGNGKFGITSWEDFKTRLYHFMKADKNRNTVNRTFRAIKHLEEVKKPRFLHDVTPDLLQKTKDSMLNKGLKNANTNRLVGALKTAMRQAEDWQLIYNRNWKVVKKIKVPKGRIIFHTPEEINKLLAACHNTMWRLIVLLGVDAGLRRGEITDLRWQDVDFENNQLYIAPNKTVNYRYIPMTDALRKTLEIAKKDAINEFVINAGKFGMHVSKNYLTRNYPIIAKAAGVPSFLHKLRHTFASRLIQNNVDIYVISKLMGHNSITVTEIYAHLLPENFQKAVMNLPSHEEVKL